MVVRPPPWLARILIGLGLAEPATPATPTATVTFHPAPNTGGPSPMASPLIGTVTPGPADQSLVIAKRIVTVTVTSILGIEAAPLVQDAIGGPVQFPIETGDSYKGTLVDVSAGGVSSLAFEFGGVAHDTTSIPATPTAVVTFAPAPPPAPAPTPVDPTPAPAAA